MDCAKVCLKKKKLLGKRDIFIVLWETIRFFETFSNSGGVPDEHSTPVDSKFYDY